MPGPLDFAHARSLAPRRGRESPRRWSTSKTPKVSLTPRRTAGEGLGRERGSTPEAEVRVRPSDCSQLSLPSSIPVPPAVAPSPGQVTHAHRAQAKTAEQRDRPGAE